MNKRSFLQQSGGALALAAMLPSAHAARAATAEPALLTLTGNSLPRSNRSALDGSRDMVFAKHKVQFDMAFGFDFTTLAKLSMVSIQPVLEYDSKAHQLRGPLLIEVLQAAGIKADAKLQVSLRAIDGYVASYSLQQIRDYRFMLALSMDGQPLGLGGLGPIWAVFDVEKQPERAKVPLAERFGGCPWALYHIALDAA